MLKSKRVSTTITIDQSLKQKSRLYAIAYGYKGLSGLIDDLLCQRISEDHSIYKDPICLKRLKLHKKAERKKRSR